MHEELACAPCPVCGATVTETPEYGVGGHIENLTLNCGTHFTVSPYDLVYRAESMSAEQVKVWLNTNLGWFFDKGNKS